MTISCPLDFESYCSYWFGDLDAGETEALEAHLFSCSQCASRAESWGVQMTAIEKGLSKLPRAHMSRQQLEAMGSQAVVIPMPHAPDHFFDLVPGAVHVFAVPVDDKVRADLERIDVEYLKEGYSEPIFEVGDVPVPLAGEPIHLACHSHVLASHGDTTMRVVGSKRGKRFTVYETLVRFA
jgi:hypothetical protein